MRSTLLYGFVLLLALLRPAAAETSAGGKVAGSGRACSMTLTPEGDLLVTAPDGATARFSPVFGILHTDKNPNLEIRWGKFRDKGLAGGGGDASAYHVLTWGKAAKAVKTEAHVADGYDPSTDRFYGPDRSPNLFQAGTFSLVRASSAKMSEGRAVWEFPATEGVSLVAEAVLPDDGFAPRLSWKATVQASGWYSIGYLGAPSCAPGEIEGVWQPLIYTGRRFPEDSFLEASGRCPLPGTFVTAKGVTTAVVAESSELPYQPMPTMANSRFGVSVRNREGQAQPFLFAPILGGLGSKQAPSASLEFSVRLLVAREGIEKVQERVARELFGFADLRHNALGSLNKTLERMLDFGMSSYARFNSDLRGFAYDTDVPGSVKNVSALHPLSLALISDDRSIYEKLALPQMEFFVSRERFLFSVDPNAKGQSVTSRLGGLGGPLSEYAALYTMSGGRVPFFKEAALSLSGKKRVLNLDSESDGGGWSNALALYRATGDKKWLARARKGADDYIRRRIEQAPVDFRDPESRGMFFWTSYAPQWIELFELYEETGEKRYLEAAHAGARNFAQYVWLSPAVPEGEVTVNQGGFAPSYRTGTKFSKVRAEEENVPAWLVSEIGLTPESSGTSRGHRGILLACYAPWMLRLAALTDDRFLHDIARSAVIGRYQSFPGYHLNTARTTVYQKPHFAERPQDELNSMTSIHYNHIWAHIALLMDYLVSDADAKSGGQVRFPSRYVEAYGYLQQKVYGDRPGKVYDYADLHLWMPRGAVEVDQPELNYLVARGDGVVAVVLTNQSKEKVRGLVRLNPEKIGLGAASGVVPVSSWKNGARQPESSTEAGGGFVAEVEPEGVTAVVFRNVTPKVGFQAEALSAGVRLPESGSVVELGFREGKAVAFSLGTVGLTSVYVYLPDFGRELVRCTLFHRQGGDYEAVEDRSFPFDFTVQARNLEPVELYVEVELRDGHVEKSPVCRVKLQ